MPLGPGAELQTSFTSIPWSETYVYGQAPRTSTLAASVDRCWSESGRQLSEDYCLERALEIAFTLALAGPEAQQNTSAIGARSLQSAWGNDDSLLETFEVVDLEFDGREFRPHENDKLRVRHSQRGYAPPSIRYSGTLPKAFLYRRKMGNDSVSHDIDRPMFVATDGLQQEVAHLQTVAVTSRDDRADGSELVYEAGQGIKIQRRSRAVTSCQHVHDWLKTDYSSDESSTASVSEWLVNLAKGLGYLGFELGFGAAAKYGEFIMVAESLGFGKEWESNWNWCFTPGHAAGCAP